MGGPHTSCFSPEASRPFCAAIQPQIQTSLVRRPGALGGWLRGRASVSLGCVNARLHAQACSWVDEPDELAVYLAEARENRQIGVCRSSSSSVRRKECKLLWLWRMVSVWYRRASRELRAFEQEGAGPPTTDERRRFFLPGYLYIPRVFRVHNATVDKLVWVYTKSRGIRVYSIPTSKNRGGLAGVFGGNL